VAKIPKNLDPSRGSHPKTGIYVFILPTSRPLSNNKVHDRPDFENITIVFHEFQKNDQVDAKPDSVFIVPNGKLGSLPLGLLHSEDYQKKVDQHEAGEKHKAVVEAKLSNKRRGLNCVILGA
jgi:hypothetical protein